MKGSIHFILLLFVFIFPGFVDSSSFDWNLERNENGIKIYLKEIWAEDIKAFRGVMTINASVDSLLAVIMDLDACTEWVHHCQNPLMLERIKFTECYHYQIHNLPFPVVDREFILHTKISREPVSGAVTVDSTSRPDYCLQQQTLSYNLINQSSLVRVRHSHGSYLLEPVKKGVAMVTWTQHTNPGGNLPAWLVNKMVRDVPFLTLQGLRTKVTEKKYQQTRLILDSDGAIIGMDQY